MLIYKSLFNQKRNITLRRLIFAQKAVALATAALAILVIHVRPTGGARQDQRESDGNHLFRPVCQALAKLATQSRLRSKLSVRRKIRQQIATHLNRPLGGLPHQPLVRCGREHNM